MPVSGKGEIQARKEPVQLRSIARVEKILNAARTILHEKGLAAVTTSSIAHKARVPIGSIYQYFPNKKAVFFALYEAYLAQMKTVMEEFEQARFLKMGWREFFTELLINVKGKEQRDTSELELFKAILVYPELQDIDQKHGQESVNFMVKHLLRLGAQGSSDVLARMAWLIYELNNAAWFHQMREDARAYRQESIEWERRAIIGVLESVFPEK